MLLEMSVDEPEPVSKMYGDLEDAEDECRWTGANLEDVREVLRMPKTSVGEPERSLEGAENVSG